MHLSEINFVDLYIGHDYHEIKGMKGGATLLAPLPVDLSNDVACLKDMCIEKMEKTGRNEFPIFYDDRLYRITVSTDVRERRTIVIRQTHHEIADITILGYPSEFINILSDTSANGLIVISGLMGAGKTTSAAASLSFRLSKTSALGVAIEDPVEVMLEGKHGDGRCFQMDVSEHNGYSNASKKALRMGVSNLFIGEIRDAESAYEALKSSMNGLMVIVTIHAASHIDAIKKIVTLCNERVPDSHKLLSGSIIAVAHQTLSPIYKNGFLSDFRVGVNVINFYSGDSKDKLALALSQNDLKSLKNELVVIRNKFLNNGGKD
ncbi:Flp pilus assembly complex ATPase component TadA [Dickeya dadantii]|uniref:ATPase, T2SS/T4P/T4SS family n=1 Tax=Dickeya dadantii TaxID=204038 RepID=UPI001495A11C|nr:ATPase, T2SS/T4P/T4SS family [Dickeya dadantii]NPE55918.1 Flp pilus assembly complex ATPase component TadA [Dickeya dadantii]NPE67142.1 Flp pilus assembly complex ATPase component TadA [Dickeya dadantii]